MSSIKSLTAAEFAAILKEMPAERSETAFAMAQSALKEMNGEIGVDVAFMAAVQQLAMTIADITGGPRDIRFLCSIAASLTLQAALAYDVQDQAHFAAAGGPPGGSAA